MYPDPLLGALISALHRPLGCKTGQQGTVEAKFGAHAKPQRVWEVKGL